MSATANGRLDHITSTAISALVEDVDQLVKLAYSGIEVQCLGVDEFERLARIHRTLDLLKEAVHGHDE